MSWRREYRVEEPGPGLAYAAGIGVLLGAALLPFRPWMGAGLLLLALVALALGRALAERYSVACDPAGITVVRRQARAATRQVHAWHDVTATEYTEGRPGRAWTGRFTVRTAAGPVCTVPAATEQFRDLIEICNAMTPHLPYVWQATVPRAAGAPAFQAVPRPPV